ncbi:PTS system N-acetylglucosamine-specific IIB component, Glc family /PTS system N-acetylglucosamine-specific IIC component, Glc family [Amphiplicatus metriothermophilus]|uniref:PTS system N-acetylglucosamine-specific IIB component, Glc family /PTS system N-acetylglucosamine-specific IIC component, Glc family n=2 Tax=Amphiplicatus metriothermophilus TaxID=1519374 RepID=A0A239PP79_9PROT|nr:PTS system N-acetylglucosamine-specific IIB component, Glc family /PTS system N-acetylglucosamine-specific IIC component, Glc family [Amphiplicatus metriothermophilus]
MKQSFAAGAMAGAQRLGRSLMLPIAVLPIAGLLLRVGQPDMLAIPFVAAAGEAIFANLGLLFALGVAVGFARENHGAAGLAGAVGFLVATQGAGALIAPPAELAAGWSEATRAFELAAYKEQALSKMSVPIGILSGVVAGLLYNRYADIRLPDYLAFFGGRRFVPIASGFVGLGLAFVFGFGWAHLERAMDAFSLWIVDLGGLGLFLYGAINRVLIVTGLHHILNNVAWFIVGDYEGATGDLRRFFAGDPEAGAFMSGFFPVMMFGLPAACLAMYHAARPERRKAVGGMLLSMALTSFLTGVTEPIEFAFMFLAPLLYAAHALLTGLSMALMDALGAKLGFGFSAGLFDYILNYRAATRPWLLLPVGAAYFALYYAVFRACIAWFDLKTPGREAADEAPLTRAPRAVEAGESAMGERGSAFVVALGGADNLLSVDACTTRLRLTLADQDAVDRAALARLGAKGVVSPGGPALQVVLGPVADQVAAEMRAALPARTGERPRASARAAPSVAAPEIDDDMRGLAKAVLDALGGAGNVTDAEEGAGRLCVRLADAGRIDEAALRRCGARALARPSPASVQLLRMAAPARLAAAMKEALGQAGAARRASP